MATYTVVANAAKSNSSAVVIEFRVPAGSNVAGVPWQTVVAELRDTAGTVNPRKASDTAHIGLLDAGAVIEIQHTVTYDARLVNSGKVAVLDAAVAARAAEFSSAFTALYEFYGTERNTQWLLLGEPIQR